MPTYQVNVTGRDAFNGTFQKRFEVVSLDHATALTDAAAMITDLQALCAGGILKYTVAEVVFVNETPGAGSNRDEGLTFALDLGNGKRAVLKVPAPEKSVVQASRAVDLSDVLVTNFLDNFINGPFVISDGETAVGVLTGVLDE